MTLLIVDDEPLARQRLERMLNTLQVGRIVTAEDADTARELIGKHPFDAVFLDINMPGVNGIEFGYELRYLQPDLPIIFQTAYDAHALEAFDVGAVGYLLKPYTIDALQKSLERVTARPPAKPDDLKLLVKNGDRYYLLAPEEIYYIKADLSEVMVRSKRGFSYLSRKISDLEPQLTPHGFFRIHRSYLLNTNHIKQMQTIEQSKIRFSFDDISDEVESSKDGAKLFREMFA